MAARARLPRIAMITPYYWPVVGGITTYVDGLTRGLRERGAEVRIWTQYGKPSEGVKVGPKYSTRFLRWTRNQLRAWRPDVVHAHAHWYTLAAGFTGTKPVGRITVFTIHTDLGPKKNPISERYLRRLFAKADVITAASNRCLEDFFQRFPTKGRKEVLTPGVRPMSTTDEDVKRLLDHLRMRESFPKLCAVSMMVWPEKVHGLKILVQSMPRVLRRLPFATLVLVGDGAMRPSLEKLATDLGVSSAVRFVGIQEDPGPYLRMSDLVVHISMKDMLPQVVLEALQVGRPVLANREVAAIFESDPMESGIVPVLASPDHIADEIVRLSGDGALRTELGDRAVSFVARRFTWEKAAEHAFRLYGLP